MPRVPYKPNREDDHSSHHADIHERLFEGLGLLRAGAGILIEWDGSQYKISSRASAGGGQAGWRWADPIELPAAPYPSYQKGEIIHIQADHVICTTGIRDAAAAGGALKQSKPGKWVALQSVPAQQTVAGNPVWNLPQWPLPVPTNYDDPANFWDYIPEVYC